MKKKNLEHICGNCLLYNRTKGECKVAVLIEGKEYHMPVFPKDKCHLEELDIPVDQVRWWVDEDKSVKIEYPENFFGSGEKSS
jgi:hypothetical protein